MVIYDNLNRDMLDLLALIKRKRILEPLSRSCKLWNYHNSYCSDYNLSRKLPQFYALVI